MAEGKTSEPGTARGEAAVSPSERHVASVGKGGHVNRARGRQDGGLDPRRWRDLGVDVFASTKGRVLDKNCIVSHTDKKF